MGRANGRGRGGGASATGARVAALLLPDRDSVIIGFGDDYALAYYSPRDNKFLEVEADVEIIADSSEDFDQDYFQPEMESLEDEGRGPGTAILSGSQLLAALSKTE